MNKVIFSVLIAMSLTSLSLSVEAKPIPATAVPEPEVYPMMLAGLALVGYVVRKKSNGKNKD